MLHGTMCSIAPSNVPMNQAAHLQHRGGPSNGCMTFCSDRSSGQLVASSCKLAAVRLYSSQLVMATTDALRTAPVQQACSPK